MASKAWKIFYCIREGWLWWLHENNRADDRGFMIWVISMLLVIIIFAVMTRYVLVSKNSRKELPLPPGPRGLPLVGNLPFLKPDLHRYFSNLANIYGPIFKLKLANKLCVVVSSPSLAKEIFKDHDATFANHNPPIAALALSYGGNDMLWSPHGPNWLLMRKVFVREMMSNTSLNASHKHCRQGVQQMLRKIHDKAGMPIDIGETIFETILSIITSMLWGGTLTGEKKSRIGIEFRKLLEESVVLTGKINFSDIFPVLARFDVQGIEKKAKKLLSWVDHILDSVINEKLKTFGLQEKGVINEDSESKDILHVLLELKQQGEGKTSLTMTQIKALLLDFIAAGTDTTTTTLEWAMAEIMQNPDIMTNAQEELAQVVGMNHLVEESHLSKLQYLDATIKETLRLHPTVPLLVPHCPSQSSTIGQYTIPKGTNVFLNVWKIHRDPEVWEHPLEFLPERFLEDTNGYDYKGINFNYLPFGSGRRMCAGIPLAKKLSTYLLASLLHSFEWRFAENVKPDLSEEFGLLMKKATPLVITATARIEVGI